MENIRLGFIDSKEMKNILNSIHIEGEKAMDLLKFSQLQEKTTLGKL